MLVRRGDAARYKDLSYSPESRGDEEGGSEIGNGVANIEVAPLKGNKMELPYWVEQSIKQIPSDFSGRIVVTMNCWTGGVANLEISTIQQAPKPGSMKRDERK